MKINILRVCLLTLGSLPLALSAIAQVTAVAENEVARNADELRTDIASSIDRDVADTALVFSNGGGGAQRVACRGFDSSGRVVGRTVTAVPPNGLRYIRASDLGNGTDFVGSARCWTGRGVIASAVFLAPGAITNLDVASNEHRWGVRVRFPVVATY